MAKETTSTLTKKYVSAAKISSTKPIQVTETGLSQSQQIAH